MEKTASDCRSLKIALTISTQDPIAHLVFDIVKTIFEGFEPGLSMARSDSNPSPK
jgi:hypothetical protein